MFLEDPEQAFESGKLEFFSALEALRDPNAFARYLAPLRKSEWVVYAKPPFDGPEQVLEYLGRYTHRVAISNNRLCGMQDDHVAFRWKDYRHHNRPKAMILDATEFIRRFLLHVLPHGLQRIRHYGLLGNRYRADNLARCRSLLGTPSPPIPVVASLDYRDRYEQLTGCSLYRCLSCHEGHMAHVQSLPRTRHLWVSEDTS